MEVILCLIETFEDVGEFALAYSPALILNENCSAVEPHRNLVAFTGVLDRVAHQGQERLFQQRRVGEHCGSFSFAVEDNTGTLGQGLHALDRCADHPLRRRRLYVGLPAVPSHAGQL